MPAPAHREQGEILVEDLRRAIAAIKENDNELIIVAIRSPFNQEVHEVRLLENQTPKTILTTLMTLWNYTWFQNWPSVEFLLSP